MIKKHRNISYQLRVLKALTRRVRKDHWRYPDIVKEHGIKQAGYKGEQSLDYYFNLLPKSDLPFSIFQDLRLPHSKESFFQMDYTILHPNFTLILEVKNYKGTLTFDPKFQQVIQEVENNPILSLPDPILQVKMQEMKLIQWMKSKNLPILPIERLVVMANPKAVIKVHSHHSLVERQVIKAAALHDRVQNYLKKYPTQILNKKDFKRISSLFIKENTPSEISPVIQFGIIPSDIVPGVFCQRCIITTPMTWHHGKWLCKHCSFVSLNAHLPALEDYALLISPTINNKELRRYLLLDQPHTARRIIQSTGAEYLNTTQGTFYTIKF
ncbi:MAG: nuclease-related domain-containing protein [Bacillota bacterium]